MTNSQTAAEGCTMNRPRNHSHAENAAITCRNSTRVFIDGISELSQDYFDAMLEGTAYLDADGAPVVNLLMNTFAGCLDSQVEVN